jgi:uncharacterized ferritin-like protein (DUF455 family)
VEIADLARRVLLCPGLDEKLAPPEGGLARLTDRAPGPALPEPPAFPARAPALRRTGRAPLPGADRVADASSRARLLHVFANHELQAMELLALVLLRHPGAPAGLRLDLANTLVDEQRHLALYLERMRAMSVDLGDFPLSVFLWQVMRRARSPLEFLVAMGLTFEQANLDHSEHYRRAVLAAGDAGTAAILARVHADEVVHVRRAFEWFERLRAPEHGSGATAWDAYVRLLPAPLSARRARGLEFCREARQRAGLPAEFIRRAALATGSRGRPPAVWWFNPLCEREVALALRPPRASPVAERERIADLEHVPMFLASPEDLVLTGRTPDETWLLSLREAGFALPEVACWRPSGDRPSLADSVPDRWISGLEPWGWSPAALELAGRVSPRLSPAAGGNAAWLARMLASPRPAGALPFARLFSKVWSAEFLAGWLARRPECAGSLGGPDLAGRPAATALEARDAIAAVRAAGWPVLIKAPLGTAGAQVHRVPAAGDAGTGALAAWVDRTIHEQGAVVVEPELPACFDLSVQITVSERGTRVVDVRRSLTGPRFAYRGTVLGPRLAGLTREAIRFLQEERDPRAGRPLARLEELARDLGDAMAAAGYEGPAGVDALLWRAPDGGLRLKPLVELNPRWTMGRVALALSRRLAPSTGGVFALVPLSWIRRRGFADAAAFARAMSDRHPLRTVHVRGRPRISGGVVFTSDPARVRRIMTVMAAAGAATDPDLMPAEPHGPP